MESWSSVSDNSILKNTYQYDLADDEDIWRQENGFAPKAIDSDIKRISSKGYRASKFYTNDENGAILNNLYSYDADDPEDALNLILGRTPKAFKYDTSDEDKARERDGLLPIAAETYISNSKQFAAEYTDYAAKMQEYANKKYEYDNLPWLTKLFTAEPKKPYSDEEMPATIQALMQYKNELAVADELAQVEGRDFFSETGENKQKVDMPHFVFDASVPINLEEFTADEPTITRQKYKQEAQQAVNIGGMTGTGLISGNDYTFTIADVMMPSADKMADAKMQQDVISQLKASGEYDRMLKQQQETAARVNQYIDAGYSKENYDYVMQSIDAAGALDITGGTQEINDLAVTSLKRSATPGISAVVNSIKALPDSSMVGANIANATFEFDLTIKDIKSKLDALGWNGEAQSDNAEIQTLIDQAEYRIVQLRKDNVEKWREQLKQMPSWLVAVTNGMTSGVESFGDSIETVALELGKLGLNQQFYEPLDERVNQIATESMNRDIVAQQNVARGKGASDTTAFIYDVSKVATEMGLNIALGQAVGAAAAPLTAGSTASALTGWKAVASKVLTIRPQTAPLFISSLGHNLMQGELEGRTDAEKWLQSVPAAYFETIIEQSVGFFSGRSAPIATLIKNGTKGAAAKTLGNVAISLLENTVGEAIEENLQDITGEFFRDIMWSDDYKANYLDWDQIGDTTKTTIAVGLLMSLFGLPSGAKSFNVARNAEASFNKAVDAYKVGDMNTFNSAMSDLKTQYEKGLDMMQADAANGTLQSIIETTQGEANTNTALIEMRDATRAAMELRSAKAGGVNIAQSAIDIADARANQAIQAMRVGVMGRAEAPATLYDQIATSEELTQMANRGGLASRLIAQNQIPLTDLQIQVLRNVETMAQENPYVDIAYTESTTPETLQKEIESYTEKTQSAQAELKSWNDTMNKEVEAAYAKSPALGQMKYSEMIRSGVTKQIEKLNKSVGMYKQRLTESKSKFAGYNAQADFMQRFFNFGTQAATSPVEPTMPQAVQTQAEADTAPQNMVATMPDRAVPMQGTVNDIIGASEPLSKMAKQETPIDGEAKVAKVLSDIKRDKPKESVKSEYNKFRRQITDTGAAVMDFGKEVNDDMLYPLYNHTKQSPYEAQYMIGKEQRDINGNIVGKSLLDIYKPIYAQGNDFRVLADTYVYHLHNIDRMTIEERGYDEANKPVFGESVTAEDSKKIIAEMEAEHPELYLFADELVGYHRNLLKRELDSHKISQETYDYLVEKYPHYVPTDRHISSTAGIYVLGRTVSVADTIRTAKGGNQDLLPLDESTARKTIKVVQAVNENILGNRLYNNAMNNPEIASKYVSEVAIEKSDYDIDGEIDTVRNDLPNSLRIYRDGEVATLKLSDDMYFAFKEMQSRAETFKIVDNINTTLKKLITAYNPVFWIKNLIKDVPDAVFNSKHSRLLIKKMPAAIKEIATSIGSSYYDYNKGLNRNENKLRTYGADNIKSVGDKIESLSMALEQFPRFAEFLATIEKGGMSYENIMQATYDAAEVTVNFGRNGKLGRTLNRTLVMFFNPAVQGSSRLIRRFTETKGVAGWTKLVINAVALGVLPSIINNLIYSDDEEYENITPRDKDRYYLFKIGNGYWAQIPKARVLSLFGGLANRLTGEYGEADAAGFIQLVGDQVAPINPLVSNIASPVLQAGFNTTWYGTDIESQYLEDNFAPGQRYDESTDAFSKWLGEATNFSPKKINYLLDQYTGVIGDFLLPATTPEAEQGGIFAPWVSAFTLDVKTSNKLSTEFYNMKTKITQDMNSDNLTIANKAKADNKIIQKFASDISELNKLIRTAQNSDKPDDEKLAIVRDLKATIGGLQQSALKMLKD
jgi:hypothetical protein